MPSPDPTPLIIAFNAWLRKDLDLPPAAVTETSVQSLLAATDTPAGQQAQAEANRYFGTRPITHLEVTGNDDAHDLLITLQIAYDAQASLLFSFLGGSD